MINTKNKYWIASFAETLYWLRNHKILSKKECDNLIDSLMDDSKSNELDDRLESFEDTCKIYSSTLPSLQNNFMCFLEIESLVRNLVVKKKADLTISISVEGKNRTVCVYGRDLFCGKRIEISGSVGYVLNELKKKYKRK